MNKSFTLIEILVVLILISVLTTVLIIAIKPADIFKKSRDSKRISDLKNIEKIFDLIHNETQGIFSESQYASLNVVYVSLQDSSSTCGQWLSQLPPLPSGWSYRCSATPTNVDGTGWIPIPFNQFSTINLSQLPIDPINKPPYYYSYIVGGSYELTAKLEINREEMRNDNGTSDLKYEVGTNLNLDPIYQDRIGLVGYWSFDDCTAKDLSGNNNNGTLVNGPTCVDGKVGKALSFDGVNDYVSIPHSFYLDSIEDMNKVTIIGWAYIRNWYSGWFSIIDKYEATGDLGWVFEVNSSLGLRFNSGNGYINSGLIPSLTRWVFVVVSYDKNKNKINFHLDLASKEFNFSANIKDTSGEPLYIGFNPSGGDEYSNGFIDEVRIYNRALSDQEIKALYEATK
ncbi:MAG: hypothetical protein KatS3mg093_371 [Candidatus Parcubacteria bacterium]|nr:MAG: hypothetical protein KatS3mg093_371 [Candidatus Parcubacteria bacterium]